MPEQLGLMPDVTLEMSFESLLGKTAEQMPVSQRRQRWARWLKIARKRKATRDLAQGWTDTDGCVGCIHLRGSWCTLQSLPCTVNPILSFRRGLIGMACMGAGYEKREVANA